MTLIASKQVTTPDHSRLFGTASEQGGYFTSRQAQDCGFSRALLSHHEKSGKFIRIRRGLYRFRDYPSSPREEVMAAWLAVGKDIAVVSHESALDLHDLSDVIPNAVHLTVPCSKRSLPAIPGVKIHTSIVPIRREEVVERKGVKVTSPTRTIVDAAEVGVGTEQVEMATIQAIRRGLTTEGRLREEAEKRGQRVATLIGQVLDLTEQAEERALRNRIFP